MILDEKVNGENVEKELFSLYQWNAIQQHKLNITMHVLLRYCVATLLLSGIVYRNAYAHKEVNTKNLSSWKGSKVHNG